MGTRNMNVVPNVLDLSPGKYRPPAGNIKQQVDGLNHFVDDEPGLIAIFHPVLERYILTCPNMIHHLIEISEHQNFDFIDQLADFGDAAENVWIARLQPKGMSTLTVMWGLSVGGLFLLAPIVFSMDILFDITAMGPAEMAVIASSIVHICAYFGFVWMINRSGPVFASQVGYIVTATGVLLGMAFYDERHSIWVWAALALMMIGLSLVKPEERRDQAS